MIKGFLVKRPIIFGRRYVGMLLAILALILLADHVLAQSGGGYEITAFTVDAGGGESCGGNFAIAGVIGQPDAGKMTGGSYTVEGGLSPVANCPAAYSIYLPLILK